MDFLGFTLSVWAAIAFGVLFFAMVVACTFDRHGNESPKWFVLFVMAAVFAFVNWGDLTWKALFHVGLWKNIGIYLGIGLLYSGIEFILTIRKEERRWASEWARFKKNGTTTDGASLAKSFVGKSNERYGQHRLVNVEINSDDQIVPVINRSELAENVGCWTAFWPAYAVSLVVGDLFAEVCRKVADVMASLSGRLVRKAFSKTFVQ